MDCKLFKSHTMVVFLCMLFCEFLNANNSNVPHYMTIMLSDDLNVLICINLLVVLVTSE